MNPLIEKEPASIPAPLLAEIDKPEHEPRPAAPPRPPLDGQNGGTPYGLAALNTECDELTRTPEGQRNKRLNEAAFAIGQLLAGGELHDRALVEDELTRAALSAGLLAPEISSTLRSGFEAGMAKPRVAPARPEQSPRGDTALDAAPEREPAAARADEVQYLDLVTIKAKGLPSIPWLIKGWLAKRDVAMVAGGGGIGKSTTVDQLAVALSRGPEGDWCGFKPTQACKVLVFDEEMGEDDAARLFIRLGAPCDNLKVASGQGIRLDTPEGVERLEAEIIKHRPDVVFLDSVQQVFANIPERDNTAIGSVYRELFRLRDTYGVTFVLVHHKKKTQPDTNLEMLEMVRGGTAHGTQCSTVWYAEPGRDSNHLNLTQAKRRGARKQSLQIGYHEESEDGLITLTGEGAVEDPDTELAVVSEWLGAHLADRGIQKKADLAAAAESEGHSVPTLERALTHLLKLHLLERPKRGFYRLVGERGLMERKADGNLMED